MPAVEGTGWEQVGPLRRRKPKEVAYWACLLGLLSLLALGIAACAEEPRAKRLPVRPASEEGPVPTSQPWPTLSPVPLAAGERLRVVASIGVIGDVVSQVGDELIEPTVLIEAGQDPHGYEPTARDIAAIADAHVIFLNGLGLEGGLSTVIEAARERGQPIIRLSELIRPPSTGGEGEPVDPHVWLDPWNVLAWVDVIERALASLDPRHAREYAANAAAYRKRLRALDAYIREQVARVPPERRRLVLDHRALDHFAARYGFEVIGTIMPGISTLAEPSAADLARLSARMRQAGVSTIFVSRDINPRLAEALARETGARVIALYISSPGEPGSGADSYIGMMKANADLIVKGLRIP